MAKAQPIKTKQGSLAWVTFNGEGKENMSGRLKYQADLVVKVDSPADKHLKGAIDAYWAENKPAGFKKKAKSLGYRLETRKVLDSEGNEQYNDEGEVLKEATGNRTFTFSTDTTYPSGDPKVISIFNARGSKVDLGEKKIGNGSEGNIGGAMGVYTVRSKQGAVTDAGVTLYLNSIRLTKFVEFTSEESWDDAGDGWTGEGETEGWEGEPSESSAPAVRL